MAGRDNPGAPRDVNAGSTFAEGRHEPRLVDEVGHALQTPVSTGHLPLPVYVRIAMREAYARFAGVADGRNSDVYPALSAVPSALFGLSVVSADGRVYAVGDADVPFAIMSVSKPFVFALVCSAFGADAARGMLGVNATGLPFNSVTAIEQGGDRRTNPMVNAGALATTSLIPGDTSDEKWSVIVAGLSSFAGRALSVNEEIYASASATNQRNHALAQLLYSYQQLFFDPIETVDLYTRQCALDVTATDLAVMGATLAHGGVNPITRERVIDAEHCRPVLAVMATAGMYETSGDWLYDVGLPGKSGIGGGIITVAPGKGGMATFSPPLDAAGNSVRGQLATRYLSDRLGMNLFASRGDAPMPGPSDRPGNGDTR